MRRFIFTPIAAAFACCLALTFPLRVTAAITSGEASCSPKDIKQMGNGVVGCIIPLGVSQPGHGGGSGPNNWGMCGVLNLSGSFGPFAVARIIVLPNGVYSAELAGTKAAIPKLHYSCVLFTDFKNVPPASDASASDPPPYTGGSSNGYRSLAAGNACIWAGLSGNVTTYVPVDMAVEGEAYAQYYGAVQGTRIGAQYAKSYAFCSGYTTASWKGWKYFRQGYTWYSPPGPVPLGPDDANYWCYMDGVWVNYSSPQEAPLESISAGLSLSSGKYLIEQLKPIAPLILVGANCLPLIQ
jgi:hypothetical protein